MQEVCISFGQFLVLCVFSALWLSTEATVFKSAFLWAFHSVGLNTAQHLQCLHVVGPSVRPLFSFLHTGKTQNASTRQI